MRGTITKSLIQVYTHLLAGGWVIYAGGTRQAIYRDWTGEIYSNCTIESCEGCEIIDASLDDFWDPDEEFELVPIKGDNT